MAFEKAEGTETGTKIGLFEKLRSVGELTHCQGNKKFPYTDNLCLFRSLAHHFGADSRALENLCQELKGRFERSTDKHFDQGVAIEHLTKAEECFNV